MPDAALLRTSARAHSAAIRHFLYEKPQRHRKREHRGSRDDPCCSSSLAASSGRDAIRGTSALVDGVRCAYALWPVEDEEAKKICKELQERFEPNKVVRGGVVKANGQARRTIATYVRNGFGLLVDRSAELITAAPQQADMLNSLIEAVRTAALQGQPFTKTGINGLYSQRERLPEDLRISKHKLEKFGAGGARQRGDCRGNGLGQPFREVARRFRWTVRNG